MKAISALVFSFIFLTGASGLIYQIVWQRMLASVLGAETLATAIVLAVFLFGLSTGYLFSGWWSKRLENPMRGYALLEAMVAVWGLLFPMLFMLADSYTSNWSFAPPWLMLGQGMLVASVLILPPTICMGGTVPLLTRALTESLSQATRKHAWIYALNTAGAFLGTLIAGFFLVEWLGVKGAIYVAAFINMGSAVVFWLASREAYFSQAANPAIPATEVEEGSPGNRSLYPPIVLLALAFINGFFVIGLENVIIRVMAISIASSAYAFTMIVAVFILALALGSYWVGHRKRFSQRALWKNQLLVILSFSLLFLTLDKWPYAFHLLRIAFQGNEIGFVFFHIAVWIFLMLLIGIPVALAGVTLPLLFHELKSKVEWVGTHSGWLLCINGLGSLCGSLLMGALLYYWLELGQVYTLALLLASVGLLLASWHLGKSRLAVSLVTCVVLVTVFFVQPGFQEQRLAVGYFRLREPVAQSFLGANKFYEGMNAAFGDVVFQNTGPSVTAAVLKIETPEGESLSLFSNGRNESRIGTYGGDEITTRIMAQIPAMLAPKRDNVLVIGLGTGATAAEFLLYPDVKKLAVAEIAPSIIEALPQFDNFNYNLSKDPRLDSRVGDGIRILKRSSEIWDIIVSEPSNPYVIGVEQLFTEEFYSAAREHLAEDGIFCQWLQAYATSPEIFSHVFGTMMTQFAHVYPFNTNGGDYVIIATKNPLTVDNWSRVEQTLSENQRVNENMHKMNISNVGDIAKMFEGWVLIQAMANFPDKTETLANPKLHYLALRAFFNGKNIASYREAFMKYPQSQIVQQRFYENMHKRDPQPLLDSGLFSSEVNYTPNDGALSGEGL